MKNKTIFWLYLVSIITYFLQGIEGMPGLAIFLYLKEHLHFPAEKIMLIGTLVSLAWVIKPVWGVLVDKFLTQKKWMLISLLGSMVISIYFGLSPILSIGIIILLLGLGNWNSAIRDVANDSLMCVEGKKNNICDKIQAWQWIAITVASIVVGVCGGYIAEHLTYKQGYLCLLPFYLIGLFVVLYYNKGVKKEPVVIKIKDYKKLFTNKQFLLAIVFLFLYKYSPSFGTPLMFIERDTFRWSAQWLGNLAAICSVIEIIGAIIFYRYCKKMNIKKWLYISIILGACTSLAYLWFTPITAVIYGVCFSGAGMLFHLIIMSWMAKSTISGMEATSFALLCSISNLSGTFSSLTGAWLLPLIGLQWLIILSAGTSFLCLPLISKLNLTKEIK